MRAHQPVRLHLVIPFHQPLTTSDESMAEACEAAYLPILDAIDKAPGVKLALHFNGHLLDYLARLREDVLLRLKNMVKRAQVEVLGGMFYGGIAALMPELDVRGQVEMAGEFWDSFIGEVPSGFWLSELAWTQELPRLLEETGLEYGFVSDSQLHDTSARAAPAIGSIERGGMRLGAYVLDSALSTALPARPVSDWIEAVMDRGASAHHQLLNVWVRAESLGLEPGTQDWCHKDGWLTRFFTALEAHPALKTVLPRDTYRQVRPVEPLLLRTQCAQELQALGQTDTPMNWTDFPFAFSEVDTLHRRMIRASSKLSEAIGIMEDEELEDSWSDALATAQRLVFAAQVPDAYWRGAAPGFSDPTLRDATVARLLRAESIIDGLVQGEEDWLSTEEEDVDGDLLDEVFVATRRLLVWLAPGRGGEVRTLDDRAHERNVLDAGAPRTEPFAAAIDKAPLGGVATIGKRGEHLRRLDDNLQKNVAGLSRRGIRHWVMPMETTPAAFFAGKAAHLTAADTAWEVLNNGIDEDGDLSYTLSLSAVLPLVQAAGQGAGPPLHVTREINIPIDEASLQVNQALRCDGRKLLCALEIPLRLGLGPCKIFIDGKQPTGKQHQMTNIEALRVEGADGSACVLEFAEPCDLWWAPLRSTVRDLAGYRPVDEGIVVVPVLKLDGEATWGVTLTLTPRDVSVPQD